VSQSTAIKLRLQATITYAGSRVANEVGAFLGARLFLRVQHSTINFDNGDQVSWDLRDEILAQAGSS